MPDKPGDDFWSHEEPEVLVRVAKLGESEYLRRYPAEKLQAVLDKAAREFSDPTRPKTRPMPEPSAPSSPSRRPSSRRTRGSTGG